MISSTSRRSIRAAESPRGHLGESAEPSSVIEWLRYVFLDGSSAQPSLLSVDDFVAIWPCRPDASLFKIPRPYQNYWRFITATFG